MKPARCRLGEEVRHMAEVKDDQASSNGSTKKTRSSPSQEDLPGYSLDQALRVPRAIAENYAYNPILCVVRTPNGGDYGVDLLARHYANHEHPRGELSTGE